MEKKDNDIEKADIQYWSNMLYAVTALLGVHWVPGATT